MSARPLRALVGAALLIAGVTLGSSAVGAAARPQTVTGFGLAGLSNGFNAFRVDFHASTSANGTARGQFRGTGRLTGLGVAIPLPVTIAGPVTCLTVRGDTAAFTYPLTTVSPAPLQPVLRGTSIEITVTRGSAGRPARIGFLGPIPTALATSCAPRATPFTLEGTVSVDAA